MTWIENEEEMKRFIALFMAACMLCSVYALAEEKTLDKEEILQNYLEWSMSQDGIVIEDSLESVETVFDLRVGMLMESGKTQEEAEQEVLNFYIEKMSEAQVQHSLPESASEASVVKNVEVPVGEYIVGTDIPAGTYTLASDSNVMSAITVNDYEQHYSINSDEKVGRIVLEEGDIVNIQYGGMLFSTYVGLNWE